MYAGNEGTSSSHQESPEDANGHIVLPTSYHMVHFIENEIGTKFHTDLLFKSAIIFELDYLEEI